MPKATVRFRMDSELKEEFSRLMDELGLSVSEGITIFARAAVRDWGIPFELKGEAFSEETVRAMEDVTAGRNLCPEKFSSTEDLMDYLNA